MSLTLHSRMFAYIFYQLMSQVKQNKPVCVSLLLFLEGSHSALQLVLLLCLFPKSVSWLTRGLWRRRRESVHQVAFLLLLPLLLLVSWLTNKCKCRQTETIFLQSHVFVVLSTKRNWLKRTIKESIREGKRRLSQLFAELQSFRHSFIVSFHSSVLPKDHFIFAASLRVGETKSIPNYCTSQ